MRKICFDIDNSWDGREVREFLRAFGVSAALLTQLKKEPTGITVNGQPVRSIDRLTAGSSLCIQVPAQGRAPLAVPLPLFVPYADADILVADKPAGMPVHESRNHRGDALANAVAARCPGMDAFRAVFRLDKDTSGLVLVAMHTLAAAKLAGSVQKDYYALVCGHMDGHGTIDAPIARKEASIIERCVRANGAHAVTHWQAVAAGHDFSLLKIRLETGRTHQIRVHFAYIGHPLLGDTLYGQTDPRIARQALHCKTIRFIHPITGKTMETDTAFPADIEGLIKCLPIAPTTFLPAK